MTTRTLLIVALLAMSPLAGCIENMQDLKDRIQPAATTSDKTTDTETPTETVEPLLNDSNQTDPVNTTPPVARITVFGANGALVFKSTFIADDEEAPIMVKAPVKLRLLAADSEAIEPGAELSTYTWDFAGMKMDGPAVEHELTEPGSYPLTLTVTDSKGGVDSQSIRIAVAPEPFEVVETITTSAIVGANGAGQSGSASYELVTEIDGKAHKVLGLVFETEAGANCDPILEIAAPDGTTQGPQDTEDEETISWGEGAPAGTWMVTIHGFACASLGADVRVTATLIQIVDGVEAGDGHGHAH